MLLSRKDCNELGAVTALLAFVASDALFLARLGGSAQAERGAGLLLLGLCVPAIYLLFAAIGHGRKPVYFAWLLLFLGFLVVEALLDFVLHVPFREVLWQMVLYVVLFVGGLGGMVGLASRAGRAWTTAAAVGFVSTLALAVTHYQAAGL